MLHLHDIVFVLTEVLKAEMTVKVIQGRGNHVVR